MVRIAFFSSWPYIEQAFDEAAAKMSSVPNPNSKSSYIPANFDLHYFQNRLTSKTAKLAYGFPVVCAFVHDVLSSETIHDLAQHGLKVIALRCSGHENVDVEAARKNRVKVVCVPDYSPYATAEHAAAMMMTLNRKLHRAYNRTRDDNFSLSGLIGFDVHGSTVGVIGTGRIGSCFARIMLGFGAHVLAVDPKPNEELSQAGVEYLDSIDEMLPKCDVVSLHCPLTPQTYGMIDESKISIMKDGAMLLNTSRGAMLCTRALINGLKSHKLGAVGLDVYENEAGVFQHDLSDVVIADDDLNLLQSFPNVLITAHQGFLTINAIDTIVTSTLQNITLAAQGIAAPGEVKPEDQENHPEVAVEKGDVVTLVGKFKSFGIPV
mmetsp:Transcript_22099/g.53949  ORF Transcript_22099/g.53949 Transcript_22099/m.53949 type:complete len:378 (-) Transcript_22099:556-1689(-)|eukprot:CAMPEP_0198320786 /NCGR_PEP_ID=MMETSP1450-20131203/9629_1 /TAXON_ID=753684 ORGANISM="Madagascaria erythrocladiodes, Strain CCMP3234" /NCGR_SAMPLE_ID=MMETSP1450 /ASSEMBLY_ACC=CAM_ASM_001115 /LENGTH=377 /DNA_ID=CAMNT_0044024279 /DNA_START=99 /DNA_END=1232 /DNA_ORIENTATION=-